MAKTETVAQVMALLETAYGKAGDKDRVKVFAGFLADIPDDFLKKAAREHVEQSKWFPTVAELRERAFRLIPGGERGSYMFLVANFGEEAAEQHYLQMGEKTPEQLEAGNEQ